MGTKRIITLAATGAAFVLTIIGAGSARADDVEATATSHKSVALIPRVGAFLPVGRLQTGPEAGLDLAVRLPLHLGGAHVFVAADAGFTSPTYTVAGTDPQLMSGSYSGNVRENELTLALVAGLTMPLGSRFSLYGGVGPLLYLLSAHENAFGTSSAEHETRSGVLAMGGLGFRLGPGSVLLDLHAELGTTDQMLTGSTGLHGLATSIGYLIPLF